MHNNKKASAQAGQKLNHVHFLVSAASLQATGDDYQKPSRQNRRQKSVWRRNQRRNLDPRVLGIRAGLQ